MDPLNGQQLIINEEAVSLTSSDSVDALLITAPPSLPLAPDIQSSGLRDRLRKAQSAPSRLV